MKSALKVSLSLLAICGVFCLLIFAGLGVSNFFDERGQLRRDVEAYLSTAQGPTARRVLDIARPHLSQYEMSEYSRRLDVIDASPKRFKGDDYDEVMWDICVYLRELEVNEEGIDAQSELAWEIRDLYDKIRWIPGRMAYDAVTKYEYTDERFEQDRRELPHLRQKLNGLIAG